jgi:hypothetical protein
MENQRFVTFDISDMNDVDKAVNSLLRVTLDDMNHFSYTSAAICSGMSSSDVEKFSYDTMINVAPRVQFDPNRIELVSGQNFPDIVLHDSKYGVEIKSTKKDSWKSTGSSIVESTRDINTERIFMLFGKLGGSPEFRCKPYQQCLSNIAVTHSPRYLIDMELELNENIFSKMATEYDKFRVLPENDKINKVREYFKDKARRENKEEAPWWMGGTTDVNISFYNDLTTNEKDSLEAKALIFFRSIYEKDPNKRYRAVSIWLINYHSLLFPNIRDSFSAGGTCKKINGNILPVPYPHIVKELLAHNEKIHKLLEIEPDDEIIDCVNEFWDFDYNSNDLYGSWISMIETAFSKNDDLKDIPIRELLESNAKPF